MHCFNFYSTGEDQEALFEQILKGVLDFPAPYWDNVSDAAKVCVWKCSPHLPLIVMLHVKHQNLSVICCSGVLDYIIILGTHGYHVCF